MNPKSAKLLKKKLREANPKPAIPVAVHNANESTEVPAGTSTKDEENRTEAEPKRAVQSETGKKEAEDSKVETGEPPAEFQHRLYNLSELTSAYGVIPQVHVTNEMVIDFIKEWQRGEREIIDITFALRLWTRVDIEEVVKSLEDIAGRDDCHLWIKRTTADKRQLLVTFYPMYHLGYTGKLQFERVDANGRKRNIGFDHEQYLLRELLP